VSASPHRWRRTVGALGGVTGAALLITVAAVIGVYQGRRFVATSSGYCVPCHADEGSHGGTRGHDGVACQSCHEGPEGWTVSLLAPLVLSSVPLADHGATRPEACADCHQQGEAGWAALQATAGHAQHAVDPGPEGCIRCHAGSLHGRPTDEEGCMTCHDDVPSDMVPTVEMALTLENDCVACHNFRTEDPHAPPRPVASAGGLDVTSDDVHSAADCRFCHSPHAEPTDAIGDCRRCHRGAIAASVANMPEAHQPCWSCHDVHPPRNQVAIPCVGCHERPLVEGLPITETLHAASKRAPSRSKAPRAREGSKTAPTAMSHEGRCEVCHSPHVGGLWAARCDQCHDDQAEALAELPEGSHESCTDCHEPHSAPPTSEVCGVCHAEIRREASSAPRRHRDCLSCHESHAGRPVSAPCATCHERPPRDLARGPAQHRQCASCHDAHGNPTEGIRTACRQCHQPEFTAAGRARDASHRECESCHQTHELGRAEAAQRCVDCHAQTRGPSASHRDNCTTCHRPHGQTPAEALACGSCHQQVRPPTTAAHSRCQDCHRPHERASQARCQECHATEARWAAAWPSGSRHAGECRSCHQPHNEAAQPTCESCHAEQSSRTHTGDHRACADCHSQHRPRPAGAEGWWTTCENCHTGEARGAARASQTHRRCQSCHDNPGLDSPACESCHRETTSRLLHTTPEHRECSRCHETHGTQAPDRASCLSCHEQQRDHYPDAPRCQACHPFAVTTGSR
jgi:hypothetical protein